MDLNLSKSKYVQKGGKLSASTAERWRFDQQETETIIFKYVGVILIPRLCLKRRVTFTKLALNVVSSDQFADQFHVMLIKFRGSNSVRP